MRRDRWIGHRPLDAATHGKPVRAGDVIAEGMGPRAADADAQDAVLVACRRHGHDVVCQALAVMDPAILRFAAWFQRREHASRCEVAGAGPRPVGQYGSGRGIGVPVPAAGLRDCEVVDMLEAIMEDESLLEKFAEWRAFVRSGG
jgi:hypothetical protein